MARVSKDIESLRLPYSTSSSSSSSSYKDKPAHSHRHSHHLTNPLPFTINYRRKPLLYTILTIITLVSLYYYTYQLSPQNPTSALHHYSSYGGNGKKIDWSRLAYSQYATDQHYLCNSLMVFASLHTLKSKADRILFYPKSWDLDVSDAKDRTSQLLIMARDKYRVNLRPVEMYTLRRDGDIDLAGSQTDVNSKSKSKSNPNSGADADADADVNTHDHPDTKPRPETWDASVNKLYAFSETQYDRIIHLDSDITLLQNIDELFFLPKAPVAMPRAYWKESTDNLQQQLTSLLIVIEPSMQQANALWDMAAGDDPTTSSSSSSSSASATPSSDESFYDMHILNSHFSTSALILPHRSYALVTGEFRRSSNNHSLFLGNTWEQWDPHAALAEAKVLHFSDWPLPKPWIMWPRNLLREMQPKCEIDAGLPTERGCEDRVVWKGMYDDFRRRRKEVCRLLSVPAPEWPPKERTRMKGKTDERGGM